MKNEWRIVVCSNDMYGIMLYVNDKPRSGIYNLTLEDAITRINDKIKRNNQTA